MNKKYKRIGSIAGIFIIAFLAFMVYTDFGQSEEQTAVSAQTPTSQKVIYPSDNELINSMEKNEVKAATVINSSTLIKEAYYVQVPYKAKVSYKVKVAYKVQSKKKYKTKVKYKVRGKIKYKWVKKYRIFTKYKWVTKYKYVTKYRTETRYKYVSPSEAWDPLEPPTVNPDADTTDNDPDTPQDPPLIAT